MILRDSCPIALEFAVSLLSDSCYGIVYKHFIALSFYANLATLPRPCAVCANRGRTGTASTGKSNEHGTTKYLPILNITLIDGHQIQLG